MAYWAELGMEFMSLYESAFRTWWSYEPSYRLLMKELFRSLMNHLFKTIARWAKNICQTDGFNLIFIKLRDNVVKVSI